jgi:cobalt-zinc-cadmium efflux system outer membrane protein
MRIGVLWTALTAAALAAACGPTYSQRSYRVHRPREVPLEPHGLDAARAGPVTLETLLRYAARNAPRLLEARARLVAGRAEVDGARAPALHAPQLDMAAGARRSSSGTSLELSASVRQPFEVSGARGARIAAAHLGLDAARAELAGVQWDVHRVVHAAFHDAMVAREAGVVATRVAEFHGRVVEFARRRLAAGESSTLEVRIAEGEAAQAAQEAAAAAGRYLEARIALALECGWPPDNPPEPSGEPEPPRDPPPLAQLVRIALADQPALQRAAIEIEHARAHVDVADRESWPPVSVGFEYGRDDGTDVYQGLLGLGLPLFAKNQVDRARARAEVAMAVAQHDALRGVIPSQITRAHVAVTTAVRRVRAYGTEILPRFEESLTLLTRALELGEIDIVELSVASGRFLAVQREALSATADYHRALADLEAAVGSELEDIDQGVPR